MKVLSTIIKWLKASNIAVFTLAMVAIVTVVAWMTFFGGVEDAVAQGTVDAEQITSGQAEVSKTYMGLGFLAAAISTSVSAVAAGIAVSIVGSAAMGAVAENPEVMGRSIIFVGLAEGIAIYGLIISIMILGKL
jgi:V/A-type H+-transporting ATPase subunit K